MPRRLLTFCSGCSLLLCMAVCGLWVRSFSRHDLRISKQGQVQWSLASAMGSLRHVRVAYPYTVQPEHEDYGWYSRPIYAGDAVVKSYDSRSREVAVAGFHYIEGDWRQGARMAGEPPMPYRAVVVPYWLIGVVAAIPPTWWLAVRMRRRRRIQEGLCPACGYDVRATPDRCPECGREGGQEGERRTSNAQRPTSNEERADAAGS